MEQNLTNEFLYGFSYPLSRVTKLIDDFDKNDADYWFKDWDEETEDEIWYDPLADDEHWDIIDAVIIGNML